MTPREPKGQEKGQTRQRILDTAERLFAEDGIDAVSLRRICDVSKANSASIHYHFRTKEGVVAAVLERGLPALEETRDRYLEPVEQLDHPTLQQIVEAMITPVVIQAHDPERMTFMRFLAGLSHHPKYSSMFVTTARRYTERHLRLIERVTPGLPEHLRVWRYALTRNFIYYALAPANDPVRDWMLDGAVDDAELQQDLVQYFVGALSAPPASAPGAGAATPQGERRRRPTTQRSR